MMVASDITLLTSILGEATRRGASDIHLRPGGPVVIRVNGSLVRLDIQLVEGDTGAIARRLMSEEQRMAFAQRPELDLSTSFEGYGRFRVNIYRQRGYLNLALRTVPVAIPTFESLRLPSVLDQIAAAQRGLVLVTGTTGSGKTHTLASIIGRINETRECHIVTIEDPIEFLHEDHKAIVSQRELGLDTFSYADALRTVVRQDPDIILIGEMRDPDTMAAAMTAAQTGHLVLSTVHTINAIQTISRVVDQFPPHHQPQMRLMLADTMRAVISQRLLPRADGAGRVPAVEVLVTTPLVRTLIEQNDSSGISAQMKQGGYYGMQTFNQALAALIASGTVRLEDAQAASSNPEELMMGVKGIVSSSDDARSFIE